MKENSLKSWRKYIFDILIYFYFVSSPGFLYAEAYSAIEETPDLYALETFRMPQISPDTKAAPATPPLEYDDSSEKVEQADEANETTRNAEESEDDSPPIADPLAPMNKVMFQVNDKLYFWLLKPVSQGYAYVVPELVRTGFSNAYDNLKAPARMVNHLLQLRLKCAGNELVRFVANSVIGIGGFGDVARDVFDIKKREADFGQTLGHYRVGHGFYIVWPILGPSSIRESIGFIGDRLMYPLTYISESDLPIEASLGISAHEKINDTSYKVGDYELFKKSVVDPYAAMRDAFVQYRKVKIEQSDLDCSADAE